MCGVIGCAIGYGDAEEEYTDCTGGCTCCLGGAVAGNIGGGTFVLGSAVDVAGCWIHSDGTKIDWDCNVCDKITFVGDWFIWTVWTADCGTAAGDVICIWAGITVVCSGTDIDPWLSVECTTGRCTTGSLETNVVSREQERITEDAGTLTGTWMRETVCREVPDDATADKSGTDAGTAAKEVWIVGGSGADCRCPDVNEYKDCCWEVTASVDVTGIIFGGG